MRSARQKVVAACDYSMPRRKRRQLQCWKDLIGEVEKDPWGLPFKIVTKNLVTRRKTPGLDNHDQVQYIVRNLFPHVEKIFHEYIQFSIDIELFLVKTQVDLKLHVPLTQKLINFCVNYKNKILLITYNFFFCIAFVIFSYF